MPSSSKKKKKSKVGKAASGPTNPSSRDERAQARARVAAFNDGDDDGEGLVAAGRAFEDASDDDLRSPPLSAASVAASDEEGSPVRRGM